MIKSEVENRIRSIARYYNTSEDVLLQMTNDERMNEMRDTSQKALHSRLIIETLIEEQKIEITDEEIEKELEQIASVNSVDIEEVKKHYESEQSMFYLKEDIKEKKIVDLLLAENSLKPGKKENYLDFLKDNA
jgi:trigger factor